MWLICRGVLFSGESYLSTEDLLWVSRAEIKGQLQTGRFCILSKLGLHGVRLMGVLLGDGLGQAAV